MREQMERLVEEQLLESYQKYYRLAFSYVKNEQDAMDIVQESAYKAIKGSDQVKDKASVYSWIYRIVINTSLDFIKKQKRERIGVEDYEQEYHDTYTDFDVMDSLSCLPEKDREVVIFRYFEDMKLSDIAKITFENENTIKTRLYRSLKKLKIQLSEPSAI